MLRMDLTRALWFCKAASTISSPGGISANSPLLEWTPVAHSRRLVPLLVLEGLKNNGPDGPVATPPRDVGEGAHLTLLFVLYKSKDPGLKVLIKLETYGTWLMWFGAELKLEPILLNPESGWVLTEPETVEVSEDLIALSNVTHFLPFLILLPKRWF